MIEQRLKDLRERVAKAALRAGRRPEDITFVAVSKNKPAADIIEAYQAGQRHFGESYVQEFEQKSRELASLPGAVFHFIGKLQSNKAKQAAKLFQVIQTVDSEKIARRLNDASQPLDVFLEVKISPEEAKGGVPAEQLPELKRYVESCDNLRLRGLMGMPPWSDDGEHSRPYFRKLRALGEQLGFTEFSMGMSHDFEVAIEEGATLVRIGTALFGKRVYPK